MERDNTPLSSQRLFMAVNFNDEVKSRILEVQDQLRSLSLKGNFTRSQNLHLTLAFLGETHDEKLQILFQIMEELQASPFEISFDKIGFFPRSRKELWWIGMDRNSQGFSTLEALHRQILALLSAGGFPVDTRPYNAHITLGREIEHTQSITLRCPEITHKVDRISLMKSEHIRGLLTYTELKGQVLTTIH